MHLKNEQGSFLSQEKKFISRLDAVIQSNLNNEHFGVHELSMAMDMNRVQLYRKVLKASGKNVSRYLREKRLQLAKDMLIQQVATASEISYRVGFSSPTYFSKCYKKYFGYTPRDTLKVIETHKRESQNPETTKGNDTGNALSAIGLNRINRHKILIRFGFAGAAIIVVLIYVTFFSFGIGDSDNPADSELIEKEFGKSIVVLPFSDVSKDQQNTYFCGGIRDEILHHLQMISDLQVKSISPYDSSGYTNMQVASLATELGVSYILEGSVAKNGDSVRISLRLSDAKTRRQLHIDSYEGKYSVELFTFQNNAAKRIAFALNADIRPDEEKRIDYIITSDPVAHDVIMQAGQFRDLYFKTNDTIFLNSSHELYKMATRIDPTCAKGYLFGSEKFLLDEKYDSAILFNKLAKDYGSEFMDCIYFNLGDCYLSMGKFDLAIENYSKALEISPFMVWANLRMGSTYVVIRNNARGFAYIIRGIRSAHDFLDKPIFEYGFAGFCFLHIGAYERAHSYLSRVLEWNQGCNGIEVYNNLLLSQGKFEEAIIFSDSLYQNNSCGGISILLSIINNHNLRNYDKVIRLSGENRNEQYDNLITCYEISALVRKNQVQKANILFKKLINKSDLLGYNFRKRIPQIHYALAGVYATMGDNERALELLETYADLVFLLGRQDYIVTDPLFENLWENPEFISIVKNAKDKKRSMKTELMAMIKRGEISLL